jgi:hypothetical protein
MSSINWLKYNGTDMQGEPVTSTENHNQVEGTSIEKSAKAMDSEARPS